MRRFCAFLSILLCLPMLCMADMVGYSGDIRRYVTQAEKAQFPYNSVVKIIDNGSTGTGTFVSPDVILTCRHVVDTSEEKFIEYYTSDGQKHRGFVAPYLHDEASEHDFAWVIDENAHKGAVYDVSAVTKRSQNLMVIGYDSLKPLSNEELQIVKRLYSDWLQKNGKIEGADKIWQAMVDVDLQLRFYYACSGDRQTDCVHCSDTDQSCIFADNNNMKVRQGCRVTHVDSQIYTNCPGASGASGAALIDLETNQIIGIACEVGKVQIGQEKDAIMLGTRPEYYHEVLTHWIDGIKANKNK